MNDLQLIISVVMSRTEANPNLFTYRSTYNMSIFKSCYKKWIVISTLYFGYLRFISGGHIILYGDTPLHIEYIN